MFKEETVTIQPTFDAVKIQMIQESGGGETRLRTQLLDVAGYEQSDSRLAAEHATLLRRPGGVAGSLADSLGDGQE